MSTVHKTILGILATLAMLVVFGQQGIAWETPESVTLDSLAKLYEPVEFDHSMHVDATDGDCTRCHHHTIDGTTDNPKCTPCHRQSEPSKKVACKDCHSAERFSAQYIREIEKETFLFHIDKPGLKGAYHLNCLWCHKENDAPTGCQDCHPRTDAGDAFFHSGKYAPKGVPKRVYHEHAGHGE